MRIYLYILLQFLFLSTLYAETEPEIRLGATIPLTGDFATYGTQIKNGIECAADELRNRGHNILVIYEDVPYPGPKAVTAIKKLSSANKIHGLAGNFLNPAIPAMAPIINRHKILAFHTAIADDLILNAGDYIVSTNAKIKDEASKLATYARKTLKANTAAILYITTTFGENYSKHFANQFEKLGGRILYNETTAIGDNDLKPVLSQVKAKKPDIFFAAYFGTNMGNVLKQAAHLGIDMPILGVYETEDSSVLEIAGASAEGVRFFVPESNAPYAELSQFIAKYQQKFNSDPLILAKNSYDATRILVNALSQCKLDTECAKEKIYDIADYKGASGIFSIDGDGAATKNFVLKTVRNGKFIVLK